MKRVLAATATALLLTACANVESAPSYLGMATSSIASQGDAVGRPEDSQTPEAVRHVTSNKVLGALAFQKVTGAKIDPTTLVGHRTP